MREKSSSAIHTPVPQTFTFQQDGELAFIHGLCVMKFTDLKFFTNARLNILSKQGLF